MHKLLAKVDPDPANKESGAYAWMTFLGIILFLLGIYASARTIINLVAFEKYPQTGVIPVTILGFLSSYPTYFPSQSEIDCQYNYYPPTTDVLIEQPIEVQQTTEPEESTTNVTPKPKTEKETVTPPVEAVQEPPMPDKFAQQQKKACLLRVEETRQQAKTNDIAQSLLFLFLGGGLLKARKKFFA